MKYTTRASRMLAVMATAGPNIELSMFFFIFP